MKVMQFAKQTLLSRVDSDIAKVVELCTIPCVRTDSSQFKHQSNVLPQEEWMQPISLQLKTLVA